MNFKQIFPLYIISLFSSLAGSVVIPILSDLDRNYGLPGADIFGVKFFFTTGSIEAGFVLVLTFSLLFWGYRVDKQNRQRIFIIGLIFFIIGDCFLLIQTTLILYYIIGRGFFMAIGLGSLGPAASSYAGDLLSFEKRSTINSTLSITGIGGIGLGILVSSLLSQINLFLPFIFLIIISLLLLVMLVVFPEPIRGSEEPEIRQLLIKNGRSKQKMKEIEEYYSRNITMNSVRIILGKRTNVFILIQGFFALLPSIIFSYYLISYLHDSNFGGVGLTLIYALLIAMGSASGRLFGFPFFGWLGDRLHFSNSNIFKDKARAVIPTITMFLQGPVMVLAFILPLPHIAPTNSQPFIDLIMSNLQLVLFGIIFFIGAFIGGGSGPNKNSIIFDINEPELRGQTTSILAIGDQLGASVGLFIGNILILTFGYAFAFASLSFGYIIAGIFWFGAYKSIEHDEKTLRTTIEKRLALIQ